MKDFYTDNHNVVELSGVQNVNDGTPDIAATVTVTMLDSAGVEVTGLSWPRAMSHVSNGLYRISINPTGLGLVEGRSYTIRIDAVGTNGEIGEWNCPVKAVARACV